MNEFPSSSAPAADDLALSGAGTRLLSGLIRLYQRTLSPALPVLTLGACACRFAPTCSHYALAALQEHGAVSGLALALRRLSRCHPFHPGGLDPVPPRRTCRRGR